MKLLSDEELQDAIYDIAECNVQDTETGEMMYAIPPQKIVDLINTQKRLYAEKKVEDFYFLLDGDIQMVLEDGGVVDGSKLLKNMRSVADSFAEQRARIK